MQTSKSFISAHMRHVNELVQRFLATSCQQSFSVFLKQSIISAGMTVMYVRIAVTYEVPRMLTKGRAYFIDAGERLRLDCQFFMETFNLFDNPVVWMKTQLNERTQMNMMGNLVEPFESTGRFRVTFEAHRPTFTLGLLIEGRISLNQPL